jgi:hypothetical protein
LQPPVAAASDGSTGHDQTEQDQHPAHQLKHTQLQRHDPRLHQMASPQRDDLAWNLVVTVAAEEASGWVIMAEEFRTDLAWT